jgi:Family of unknown function (DUF6496)
LRGLLKRTEGLAFALEVGGSASKRIIIMPKETEPQKETVQRVMHEFKHGELRSGTSGDKVTNPKQAVAIALSEAGASNQQTPKENQARLRRTKAKERRGETAEAETEGRAAKGSRTKRG